PPTGNSVVESDAVSAADPTEQTYVDLAFALALQAISSGLAANTTFKSVYGLLTSAGLTVPVTGNTGFGLNVGGWRSFVADPTNYLANRAQALLSDPSNRDTFFAVVWQILGLPTFTVPTPVLVALQALGVVQGPDQGYALNPAAAMALVRSPFATLAARFEQLTQDTAVLRALIGQYADTRIVAPLWILQFEVANSTRVSLALAPGKTFAIGSVFGIGGSISLDLQTFALSATVPVNVNDIGLSIVPALTLQPTAPHAIR